MFYPFLPKVFFPCKAETWPCQRALANKMNLSVFTKGHAVVGTIQCNRLSRRTVDFRLLLIVLGIAILYKIDLIVMEALSKRNTATLSKIFILLTAHYMGRLPAYNKTFSKPIFLSSLVFKK